MKIRNLLLREIDAIPLPAWAIGGLSGVIVSFFSDITKFDDLNFWRCMATLGCGFLLGDMIGLLVRDKPRALLLGGISGFFSHACIAFVIMIFISLNFLDPIKIDQSYYKLSVGVFLFIGSLIPIQYFLKLTTREVKTSDQPLSDFERPPIPLWPIGALIGTITSFTSHLLLLQSYFLPLWSYIISLGFGFLLGALCSLFVKNKPGLFLLSGLIGLFCPMLTYLALLVFTYIITIWFLMSTGGG